MHLLVIILQQLLGMLSKQASPQPEPVFIPGDRTPEGRQGSAGRSSSASRNGAEGRIPGEGLSPDAFVLWEERGGPGPDMTPVRTFVGSWRQSLERWLCGGTQAIRSYNRLPLGKAPSRAPEPAAIRQQSS